MKKKSWMRLLLFAFFLSLAAAGCSKSAPQPRERIFPTSEQSHARQLTDLKLVAGLEAASIKQSLERYDYLATVPVFITLPDQTDFSQNYRQALTTALINDGVRVSETQRDTLVLSFWLQDRVLLTTQLTFDDKPLMRSSRIYYAGPPTLSKEAGNAVWRQYTRRRPAYIR